LIDGARYPTREQEIVLLAHTPVGISNIMISGKWENGKSVKMDWKTHIAGSLFLIGRTKLTSVLTWTVANRKSTIANLQSICGAIEEEESPRVNPPAETPSICKSCLTASNGTHSHSQKGRKNPMKMPGKRKTHRQAKMKTRVGQSMIHDFVQRL